MLEKTFSVTHHTKKICKIVILKPHRIQTKQQQTLTQIKQRVFEADVIRKCEGQFVQEPPA